MSDAPAPRASRPTAGVRAFARDVARAWRDGRMPAAWAEAREWTVYRLFRHGQVVVVEQELGALREQPPPEGVEVRPLADADWPHLAEVANERTRARFRRAAGRGRTCLVAWRGGRPIGYIWLSDRIDRDLEFYPLPLPPGTSYGWDFYVTPAERGGGVGAALVSARLRYAREQGFRLAWRVIARSNRASFRAVEKAGATRSPGELSFVKVLGWVYARWHPASPQDADRPPTP